ncbi:unnamed protein product [Meganyctiphanes norvegica]|uniref:Fibrinogen C-terminal domain-containing protein n=1 Tax=Meganyctiphanes norvegica TaxID=48144 RepID=A0AAV2SAB3_MEGNR
MALMWTMFCLSILITSGYSEITEEQMETFKNEILKEISQLSRNIISVNNRVDELIKWKENFETIQDQINSIESDANSANVKMDYIIPTINKVVTSVDDIVKQDRNESVENSMSSLDVIKGEVTEMNNRIYKIQCQMPSRNCADLYNKGCNTSEPLQIFPYSCNSNECVSVLCDQDWTIIQRRQEGDPRENFYRPWADYVQGFGELTGEFWMGLNLIHRLTAYSKNELHVELEDYDGNQRWARYEHFIVGPAEDKYRLFITGYTGDAGDALAAWQNGSAFSTYDQDNDIWDTGNCAEKYKGAWWHNACHWANLNGQPDVGNDTSPGVGIIWHPWLGYTYSLRTVTMKIRPLIT